MKRFHGSLSLLFRQKTLANGVYDASGKLLDIHRSPRCVKECTERRCHSEAIALLDLVRSEPLAAKNNSGSTSSRAWTEQTT